MCSFIDCVYSNTKYKNYFSTQLLFHGHVASGPLLQIMRIYYAPANDSKYSWFHKKKNTVFIYNCIHEYLL